VNLWDAENTRPFVKFSKPATKEGNSLNGWAITTAVSGAPVFVDAVAWMDLRVVNQVDCGSHSFFIGELVAAENSRPEARVASMSDTRMKYGGTRRGH
jgi:flavin reductase (DIM6/NTAB) family NADH-FMN oxidoreductase RutF